ncbi:MAG: cation-translocating P-type ATPase [Candidatus Wallbacteria bacterium]
MPENKNDILLGDTVPNSKNSVIELDITGMSCVNCSNSIESYLKSNDGVNSVVVNFATGYGRIEYDPSAVKPSEMLDMISELGFNASIKNISGNSNAENSDRSGLNSTADGQYGAASESNELIQDKSSSNEISKSISDAHIQNLSRAKLKMITAAVFALPVFILNMFFCELPYSGIIMALLSLPVLFYSGLDFHKKAFVTIYRRLPLTMDALVSASSLASFFLSLYLYFFRHSHDVYFDSAASIIAIILIGKFIEERIRTGARGNITGIIEGMPAKCVVKSGAGETEIGIKQVKIGDMIIVKPHQKIPVDGEVISGEGFIENSAITGESAPVFIKPGLKVWAGAQNYDAILEIKSLSEGLNSYINEIEKLLNQALSKKAAIQKTADKISAYFVPSVFTLAMITLFIHLYLKNSLEHSIINAISVIAIACPCALGLALPVAFLFGANTGAKSGILFTDPDSLNKISSLKAIVFDKTGTLTENKLEIREIEFLNIGLPSEKYNKIYANNRSAGLTGSTGTDAAESDTAKIGVDINTTENALKNAVEISESSEKITAAKMSGESAACQKPYDSVNDACGAQKINIIDNNELLRIICSVERYSVHPVAQALTDYCRSINIDNYYEVSNYKTHGGMGISALCRGFEVTIGNASLNNVSDELKKIVKSHGGMSFYASINGRPALYAVLDEKLSSGVKDAIDNLKKKKIAVYLATGDFHESAFRIAGEVGIERENVRCEVKPDEKSALIDELKLKFGGRVAMIGDGVNDALSLARADISIAMSNAASIAKTAASIILTSGGMKNVNTALALGAKMNGIIMQNFFWAFFYNVILIPLAMAGKLNPMLAAFAMMLSSLFVVLNSTRLKYL